MSTLDDQLFAALKLELSGRAVHATRVESVDITRGEDGDGNHALFVNLTLTDPPADAGTWPSNDVQHLRRLVRDAVLKMLHDDELRWYVSFDAAASVIATDAD